MRRRLVYYPLRPFAKSASNQASAAGNLVGKNGALFRNSRNANEKILRISSRFVTRFCAGTIDDSCAADSHYPQRKVLLVAHLKWCSV